MAHYHLFRTLVSHGTCIRRLNTFCQNQILGLNRITVPFLSTDRVVSLESELANLKTTEKAEVTLIGSAFDEALSNHLDESDTTDSGLEDDDNLKGKFSCRISANFY